jgi:hypothetical protein
MISRRHVSYWFRNGLPLYHPLPPSLCYDSGAR